MGQPVPRRGTGRADRSFFTPAPLPDPHQPGRRAGRGPAASGRAARAGLARRAHGSSSPDRLADPGPPPDPEAGRLRPADRSTDPCLAGHRDPLRARTSRRAGPHGRQEDRTDPTGRRLARDRLDEREPPVARRQDPDRLRLRPRPGRRPLPAGLLRGPARREGPDLRRLPAARRAPTSPRTASPASNGS